MLIVTDLSGNIEGITGYKGLKRFRNASGEKTLSFSLYSIDKNSHSFDMVQEESLVEFNGDKYRIKQLAEKSIGSLYYKEVTAIHTFFDLIDDYQYNKTSGTLTFQQALQFVLGGTSYTFNIIDSFGSQVFEDFGNDNVLALFQAVMQKFTAEFYLVGTTINVKNTIGNATDFQFRYNYNVKTIARNVDTNSLSTYIKGYGKQNEDGSYSLTSDYTSPNSNIFGIKHAKPIFDDNFATVSDINAALQANINDTPKVSITIDFADLRRAGYIGDIPNEGDTVYLIYEPIHNLNITTRLMEITEEFEEFNDYPVNTQVTLANYKNKLNDQLIQFSNTQKQVSDILTSDGKVKYNVLDEAVKQVTQAIQSAQTELLFSNGIIAKDKTNPNNLVVLTSAGLGISKDAGATFTEAITSQGFVLSVGAVGQLSANNIKTSELIVGDNIAMGPNAVIDWTKVSNQPFIPSTAADVGARPDTWTPTASQVGALPTGTTADQIGGVTPSFYKFTHIDANGVYTGTVTASQINAKGLNVYNNNNVNTFSIDANGNVNMIGNLNGGSINITTNATVGNTLYLGNPNSGPSGKAIILANNTYVQGANDGLYLQANSNNYIGIHPTTIDFYISNASLSVRAGDTYGHTFIQAGMSGIQMLGSSSAGIQARNSANTGYSTMYATDFVVSSDRELKKNIVLFVENASDLIKTTPIYNFNYNDELDTDFPHTGIMLDESPVWVADITGQGVNSYGMVALAWKSIQELLVRIDNIEKGIVV